MRVHDLLVQLGYDVPVADIADRLERRGRNREVFVAEDDGGIAAWATVGVREDFVGGRYAEIEGFVVDERSRSAGIGTRLLDVVERWARSNGCALLRVQSNVIRERAHGFYERHGFEKVKAQFQFRKTL